MAACHIISVNKLPDRALSPEFGPALKAAICRGKEFAMKRSLVRFLGFASAFALVAAVAAPRPPVGYDALADIDRIWQYTGLVKTAMISSTDVSGGNWDMYNFHGRYRGEKVMARIDGPGCVYRIWSGLPSGRIKVYLDGRSWPEIDCAMKAYLEGSCAGLPGDFAVGQEANYMPIPFKKSIVITAPGFILGYYQVSFQTYDPGVGVETFNRKTSGEAPGLAQAVATWKGGAITGKSDALKTVETTSGAVELPGAGVIREIAIARTGDPGDPLRGARIRVFFDGASEPAVDAPVDAFFINRFDLKKDWPGGGMKNLFLEAGTQGYRSMFPMPFAQGAKIEIIGGNHTEIKLRVSYEILESLPPDSMRFHAQYKEKNYDTDLSPDKTFPTATPINSDTNYVVLDHKGAGHYLGTAIFVQSVGTQWWGEGDEMTWIDGAPEPAIRGTGTEDDFNLTHPFIPNLSPVSGTLPVVPACDENIAANIIPQLQNPECNKIEGHNILFRFRPTDYISFTSAIKVSYEIVGISMTVTRSIFTGNLSQDRGDDYSSMAYWYEKE